MVDKVPLTVVGADKLREELTELKNVVRPRIVAAISEARAHGDLKENAEYHAAKEKQRLVDLRLSALASVLSLAQIVDPAVLEHSRISFGSTIVLCDLSSDEEITYTIVGGCESNPDNGLISFNSPLAKQLLGKEEGDEFTAKLPGGAKEFEVLEVKYQEIVFDCN